MKQATKNNTGTNKIYVLLAVAAKMTAQFACKQCNLPLTTLSKFYRKTSQQHRKLSVRLRFADISISMQFPDAVCT